MIERNRIGQDKQAGDDARAVGQNAGIRTVNPHYMIELDSAASLARDPMKRYSAR
jgi:hypothetical protein